MGIQSSAKASLRKIKENKFLVYLTCLYIFVWYLQLGNRVDILGTIRFEFLLGAFLSVCALMTLISSREKPTPLKGPILFFFCVLAFYTLFSYDRADSWDVFYDRVVKFSMMAAFLAAFIRSEWALKLAIGAFLLAMIKMGQEGLVGWLGGGLVWQNQGIMRLHGSTMLYRHPNSFSGMAVGCLPFIFYLYPVANKWQKAALGFLLLCAIIIIVFTGSRTGYVATALLGMYFWREKLRQAKVKYFLIGVVVILIGAALMPEQYVGRIASIFTGEEAEGSSSDARIQIIKDAIAIFLAKPWGIGVSAFPSVRMDMFGRFQDTHSLYLELLTNLSVLGLAAFGLLVYRVIKTNREIIRWQRASTDGSLFIIALANAIIAFVLARLFLGLFGHDTYEIYWWFATGFTIALYRVSQEKTKHMETLASGNNKTRIRSGF